MAVPLFPPAREADLLAWSAQFDAKITATPVQFGLDASQATAYNVLHSTFAAAMANVADSTKNSTAAIEAKRIAKHNLLNGPGGARELVAIIQAFPGTTDEERSELRIRIRDVEPTPVPAPDSPPVLTILSTLGRTVTMKLRDMAKIDRRGLPPGVDGAAILMHVGDVPPEDPMQWALVENTTRTKVEIDIPLTVPVGAQVWFTAFWFNQRKASGPPAAFVSTHVYSGLAKAA